jgi:hypothetical protein
MLAYVMLIRGPLVLLVTLNNGREPASLSKIQKLGFTIKRCNKHKFSRFFQIPKKRIKKGKTPCKRYLVPKTLSTTISCILYVYTIHTELSIITTFLYL